MYQVFTVQGATVTPGAEVVRFTLSGGNAIAAICVGEPGRGRRQSVLPVAGEAPERSFLLMAAKVGTTRSGKPRLIADTTTIDTSAALVVLRTRIGFRGSNDHTGDRTGTRGDGTPEGFLPFPGEVLSEGRIAQGAAGYAGSGAQIVALIPCGVVFRTAYSGRLYGGPSSHYYVFDGDAIRVATWDEREMLEVDPLEVRV